MVTKGAAARRLNYRESRSVRLIMVMCTAVLTLDAASGQVCAPSRDNRARWAVVPFSQTVELRCSDHGFSCNVADLTAVRPFRIPRIRRENCMKL